MEFKDRIKELRMKNNMSQSQLAAILDRGDSAIRMWESGKSKPDMDTVLKLCSIFECSIDYLFGVSEFKTLDELKIYNSVSNQVNELLDFISLPKEAVKIAPEIESLYKEFKDFIFFYSHLQNENKELIKKFLELVKKIVKYSNSLDKDFITMGNDSALFLLNSYLNELLKICADINFRIIDKVYSLNDLQKESTTNIKFLSSDKQCQQ